MIPVRIILFLISFVPIFFFQDVMADEWDFGGNVSIGLRIFPEDVKFSDQDNYHFDPSIKLEPEVSYEFTGGNDRLTLIPFFRYDLEDDDRTHFDIREGNWLHTESNWSLLVGNDIVFWGVTESRHLVDIINQIDFVEDLDNEDKLGQPMINIIYDSNIGSFEFYYMPFFRERTFPSADARLRGPLPISNNPEYESDLKEFHPDFAFRWVNTIKEFDIGLSFFWGTSREPIFLVEENQNGKMFFRPFYTIINQVALDLQWTRDAWLLKLEAIGRGGQGSYFFATVFGFEYTIFQLFNTDADLGLVSEYLYDGRDENIEFAPPTFFDNDIFGGLRLALNDTNDTQVLVGLTTDTKNAEMLGIVEASRRIGNSFVIELVCRLFMNPEEGTIFSGFSNDSFIDLSLSYYF